MNCLFRGHLLGSASYVGTSQGVSLVLALLWNIERCGIEREALNGHFWNMASALVPPTINPPQTHEWWRIMVLMTSQCVLFSLEDKYVNRFYIGQFYWVAEWCLCFKPRIQSFRSKLVQTDKLFKRTSLFFNIAFPGSSGTEGCIVGIQCDPKQPLAGCNEAHYSSHMFSVCREPPL